MRMRLLGGLLAAAAALPAVVVRVEVLERADVLDGKSFGKTGPYEKLTGKVYFAADPGLPANRIIADIGRAPRNEAGRVEYASDVMVLKPRDPARGNGAVLLEINNRGGKSLLGTFQLGAGSRNPVRPEDFGDGFLFEQGYTLVWLGWQFDVPRNPDLMRLYPPVASENGRPILGLVRSEFVVDERKITVSLADRDHVPYPPADPAKAQLTVRGSVLGPRTVIPRGEWEIVEGTHVTKASGFEPGKLYELIYQAKDPAVVGLGPAAVRDFVSFLKYGHGPAVTALSDQRRYLKRAYAFGVSQSGRFLRTFLYYGFNADEQQRKVFDGMLVHVAGAGRGSFNHRFAQPSRDGHPFLNTLYPTDIYPFTDEAQTDPETGLNEGILSRAAAANVTPKIFYTNSSYEYWGRAASLIHTTLDGQRDFPPPDTTRLYLFAGTQHGPAGFPPARRGTQQLPNFNLFTLCLRAALVNLDRWVAEDREPPPSQVPRLADGTLVRVEELKFPSIPRVAVARNPKRAYRLDFGPDFRTQGVVTIEPPKVGKEFPVRVPQVDADGNEVAGIRTPAVAVPLGTYTGWNLREPSLGAPGEMYSMAGSFIPFARTRRERMRLNDPRPSLQERYRNRAAYLAQVEASARELAAQGHLLEMDVPRLVKRSADAWDWLMKPAKAK